jgi:hypothetical protein
MSEPFLIPAGDERLLLGIYKQPPKVDCYVVAAEKYQEIQSRIAALEQENARLKNLGNLRHNGIQQMIEQIKELEQENKMLFEDKSELESKMGYYSDDNDLLLKRIAELERQLAEETDDRIHDLERQLAQEREANRWKKIDTAPKDVSVLLKSNSGIYFVGRRRYGNLGEPTQDIFAWRCDSSGRFGGEPTHYKEITPPEADK